MIQLAQAIWLWAIAGIVVPVIIHLWNIRQGKTLKVGSIAFLTESSKAHSRSLKLSEILLLLIRCLLLVVLAFILTKPFLEKKLDLANEKGWVLIEKQNVKEVYNKFKPMIDSLLKTGYDFHYFNKGFKEVKFEDAVKAEADSINETNQHDWALLKELNQQVPAKLPLVLFTDNNLKKFKGRRPDVAVNVKWYTYTSNDTPSTWIEKAFETINDSIQVVAGNSNTNGIYYASQNISRQASNTKFNIIRDLEKTLISYKDISASNNTVTLDTFTFTVFIYTDKFSTDANFLKAAFDAIKDFTKNKIKTTVVNNIEDIPKEYDWLFWLSETEIPLPLMKNKVLLYEKGKINNVHSNMVISDKSHQYAFDDLQVFRMIENKSPENFYPIWKNGYGDALLSVEKSNDSIYHFFSRFNPQWNGLTWSNEFPQIIYNLVFHKNDIPDIPDKRIIDDQQIQPTVVDENKIFPKKELLDRTDLMKTLWFIALILFVIERIIASRLKKRKVYG